MSRKPKLLYVVTVPYVVKAHLPNTLKRLTQDFQVCVAGSAVSQFRTVYPDIEWVDLNIERKTRPLADLLSLIALCRFLISSKPDIVHSLMAKAGLLTAIAARVCRVPVRIHTFTGQVWATRSGVSRIALRMADWLINRLDTVCLTDSPSQSAFLFEQGLSSHGGPLPVLLQGSIAGVDLERFDPVRLAGVAGRLRDCLGIGRNQFVFTYIARKTRDKGALDMLHAFSILSADRPDARLLFIGPDEDGEIARLRPLHPEWFEQVIEVGQVNNHEEYLALTDVLCLPSYREGFGTVVIDAAALGVPAIGSRISGLTDAIVEGRTGRLFAAGDLGEMVELMRAFIEDPAMRSKMGEQAKARVQESFTADKLYAALRDFYLQRANAHPALRNSIRGS